MKIGKDVFLTLLCVSASSTEALCLAISFIFPRTLCTDFKVDISKGIRGFQSPKLPVTHFDLHLIPVAELPLGPKLQGPGRSLLPAIALQFPVGRKWDKLHEGEGIRL